MINYIFNILNFGVIIGVLAYAFYKYLLPSYREMFIQEKNNINNLNQKISDLITQQKQSDDDLLEQDINCKELKNKVLIWNHTAIKLKKEKEEELSKFNDLTLQKISKQSQNYKIKKEFEQVKASLAKSLKYELKEYFEDENNVKKYFNGIIDKMLSKKHGYRKIG